MDFCSEGDELQVSVSQEAINVLHINVLSMCPILWGVGCRLWAEAIIRACDLINYLVRRWLSVSDFGLFSLIK